jgi:RimJ/RimL family protein N-acetyltransferase
VVVAAAIAISAATGDRPPFPLKTVRLDLHPLQQKDVPAVFGLYSDWNVARNLFKITFPLTPEAAQQLVDEAQDALAARPAYAYTLAMVRRDDGAFVGVQSLTILAYHPQLDEQEREQWAGTGILGYSVVPAHWGHGFATEGASCMVALAFDKLQLARLQASPVRGNLASRRVLEKLGFTIGEPNILETPRYGGPPRLVDRYVLSNLDRSRF